MKPRLRRLNELKVYVGTNRGIGGQKIVVQDGMTTRPLKHVVRHSPTGFQWGYGGLGPSDAALSILTDCLGSEIAERWYQRFKWKFLAEAGKELCITEHEIREWYNRTFGEDS